MLLVLMKENMLGLEMNFLQDRADNDGPFLESSPRIPDPDTFSPRLSPNSQPWLDQDQISKEGILQQTDNHLK